MGYRMELACQCCAFAEENPGLLKRQMIESAHAPLTR